jgi:exo-beta-1,3-glucanase (GH17 family)
MKNTLNLMINTIKILIVIPLVWSFRSAVSQAASPTARPEKPAFSISLIPDQMIPFGDVTTRSNCIDSTVCGWLNGMPDGGLLLGVDPSSPITTTWDGGSVTAPVSLENIYSPTLYLLKIDWPDRDGKGLHSWQKNQTATIRLDGKILWDKRTTQISDFKDYYALQHESLLTTIVVTNTITHTLQISVPSQTAWDLGEIELTAYPAPTPLRGIGYSPLRDCQSPGGAVQPSVQNVQEDLFRLFHTANAVRTYAATGIGGEIPRLANTAGVPVYPGAWLDLNPNDDTEIQALIQMAKTDHLDGAIVGNEVTLRHNQTPEMTAQTVEYLRQKIVQVKSSLPAGIPVMSAESDGVMFAWQGDDPQIRASYRPILDIVDIVLVHIYPFWNAHPIDGAAAETVNRYHAIKALIEREYPGQNKRVIIGETGWPSGGSPYGSAVPSLGNQRRYLVEFMNLADQENVDYFYFDGFDELWKIEEPGGVGQRWGYAYTDRSAKHNFYGILIPQGLLHYSQIYLPFLARPLSALAAKLADRPVKAIQGIERAQADPIFTVYDEWPAGPDHFVPSGYMGDLDQIGLYECDRSDPYQGEMAVRVSLSPGGAQGWSGVYWQYPANNWGNLPDGLDLRPATRVTFWVKGQKGGEVIRFIVGGVGAADPYPDSIQPTVSTGFITLGKQWQQYVIDLSGKDLSHVIGGFGWVAEQAGNPQGATFYLDKILFETAPNSNGPRGP